MLIEVLFVPGCPNHEPAVERLKSVLRSEAISAVIQEIAVTDEAMALSLEFPGSPTVRVNGLDVDSSPHKSFGLACRLYSGGTGVPPLETLQKAIAEARNEMDSTDLARSVSAQTPDRGYKRQACCSSPSAMCYWCTISLAAWGLLSLVGIYWRPLHATSAATILFAASIGCFANWFKNRTFHCTITAWLFLAAATLFLFTNAGVVAIEPRFVWAVVAIGTAVAFILECRYAARLTR